ncbi:MAG: redox-sensing transcriptional repressor Rex [Oligoflexia bacterium]|nr:redox-sensing transcriptional repressor Rex [Oligoflexia bacterium]MBF0366463.1 redox-sensing transcriptional repressor Rex [Oligoflexia bacterium]
MMVRKKIPEKSVERICRYREILLEYQSIGKEFIFSHELASEVRVSPAQVRRDLMYFHLKGVPQQGYRVSEFLYEIDDLIDPKEVQDVILIGVGNLGKAILSYFTHKRPKLSIVAAFDVDANKVDRVISGCECFHMRDLQKFTREREIKIAIITVPAQEAQAIANTLVESGIRGILNFSPVLLKVPADVYLECIDITTSLEKTVYFSRGRR